MWAHFTTSQWIIFHVGEHFTLRVKRKDASIKGGGSPHVGRGLNEWKSQYRIKWRWTHAFFNYEVLRQHFLYSSVDEA